MRLINADHLMINVADNYFAECISKDEMDMIEKFILGAPTVDENEELQKYKEWVGLEDSEIIAECVHRYGGKAVVEACREKIERPTGKWNEIKRLHDDNIVYIQDYECSECGGIYFEKHNYCPNCGADMRGKDNG